MLNQSPYRKYFAFLCSIVIGVFGWSLWRRPVHVDDAWIAEYAYWFSQLGHVKSEGMRGFLGAENKLYIYHKLFVAEGALFIRLFGFNIYALKAISLIFLALSVWPLKYLYQKYSTEKTSFLLLLSVYLSFFHIMNLSFVYRPELQLVFLGLLSFVYLEKYFDERKVGALVISALLTAVAIAAHLNGMIYTGAGVLMLWVHRRWKHGFLYGVLGALGLLFYITFDVRSFTELQQLVHQFRNWRDVASANYGWTLLTRVIQEQQRFLHSPPEIVYSVMLVFLLVPVRKFIYERGKRLVLYSLLLTFCLAEVAHGSNTNYLIYAFPFFAILVVMAFEEMQKKGLRYGRYGFGVILVFVLVSLVYDVSKFKNREVNTVEYIKIREALPRDVYVLAPGTFVMQGLGYQKIQILVAYRDKVENGIIEASPDGLFTEAAKYENEYVILGQSDSEFFHVKENEYSLYAVIQNQPSEKYRVFKRR